MVLPVSIVVTSVVMVAREGRQEKEKAFALLRAARTLSKKPDTPPTGTPPDDRQPSPSLVLHATLVAFDLPSTSASLRDCPRIPVKALKPEPAVSSSPGHGIKS
ncbi:hypothetical protein Q5P01_005248 [Channa striata]|uniref:Uncharacterized protein n=1 Tax=Channa striata TaxID=64152 RepID=A0AA88NC76_CHASR|nr:hypothetical protein Q5P01_005248 [Channa striata]